MSAVDLVLSDIVHIRHGGAHHPAVHVLRRKGLSLWLDLDQLDAADRQSRLFSVGRFNLLGFYQTDHGPNFTAGKMVMPLADYVRDMAAKLAPGAAVDRVYLLTFPRLLGAVFNPLSVYVARDRAGDDIVYIYEVRNTFGDMHAYVGTPRQSGAMLYADKIFHVSPFFPVAGGYRLKIRVKDQAISLVMRYFIDNAPALTATLRGRRWVLSGASIVRLLWQAGQLPFRPIVAIHFEALKLWAKKLPFYRRPEPPAPWSRACESDKAK